MHFRGLHSPVIPGNVTRGRKNPLWQRLPNRLIRARRAAKLDRAKLDALAGVGGVVRYIEDQEAERPRVPRIDTVEKLAVALGLSPTWLAFGRDGLQPFREKISGPDRRKDPPIRSAAVAADRHVGLPERLKLARAKKHWSRKAFAREAAVPSSTLINHEEGRTVPTVAMIEQLAKALGVAPGWLAYGEGEGPTSARSS